MTIVNLLEPETKLLRYIDYYELLSDNFSEISKIFPEALGQSQYIDVLNIMAENKMGFAIKRVDASRAVSYSPINLEQWERGIKIFSTHISTISKRTVSAVGLEAKYFIDELSAALNPEDKQSGNFAILWNAPENTLK